MKETGIHISDRIGRLEFNQRTLEASFAQMGKPLEPKFVDAMRTTLLEYAGEYGKYLAAVQLFKAIAEVIDRQPDRLKETVLLWQKGLVENNRTKLATIHEAFRVLGQDEAVLDVEIAVASNYIMQDLGNK